MISDEWCMQVFIKGSQNTSQALIDIVRNKTYGEKLPTVLCATSVCWSLSEAYTAQALGIFINLCLVH